MTRNEGAIGWKACICVARGGILVAGAIAGPETRYLRIAPIEQYLMDHDAEIALARGAAPSSISANAEVLVLGRKGYKIAVKGKDGFVCLVERSWMSQFDDPESLNPDQRVPLCLNPPAARTHPPFTVKATALALSGLPKTGMLRSLKMAYEKREPPLPEPGLMCFMMSKQQYFGHKHGNPDPHTTSWFPQADHMNWGAGLPGSPVYIKTLLIRLRRSSFHCPNGRTERPLPLSSNST
jgi:hypothetical protein